MRIRPRLGARSDHLPPPAHAPHTDAALRSILVPVTSERAEVPRDMVEVAVRLASGRGALIVFMAFTEVPLSEEIDVDLPAANRRVAGLDAQACTIREAYGLRVHVTHLRTRDPADTILAEARRRRSEVILLGATGRPRRPGRGFAVDRLTRRIAGESPVRTMFVQPGPHDRIEPAPSTPPASTPAAAAGDRDRHDEPFPADGGWPLLETLRT